MDQDKDYTSEMTVFLERWGFENIPSDPGWRSIKCAVHGERQASARVNVALGAFKCLACGLSGDLLKLIMEVEKIDFKAAISLYEEVAGGVYSGVREQPSRKSRRGVSTQRARFESGGGSRFSSGLRQNRSDGTGRKRYGSD